MVYAIRVPAIEIRIPPPGKPSRNPVERNKSFAYKAGSWPKPRRIVAKVEHREGELFLRVGCQAGKNNPSESPSDLAGACSGGELVASRARELYDARV